MEVPEYRGKPLSVINRLTTLDAPRQIWLWSSAKNLYQETPEAIERLLSEGYQYVPEPNRSDWLASEWLAIASTQFVNAAYLMDREKGTAQLWMPANDIEHVRKYPASLAFALDLPTKEQSVSMLQFLPFPQIGEFAIIQTSKGRAIYEIEQLPEEARQLWQSLGQRLRDLAAPGGWYLHSETHTICNIADKFNTVLAELKKIYPINPISPQEQRNNAKERRNAKIAIERMEETYNQLQMVRQSWLKNDWLEQWKEVSRMAQELTASYYDYHQELTRKTRITPLPEVTSSQRTMLPSSNGFRGLVQSFGPGVQPGLWNVETSIELTLSTPNNSLLRVRGENEVERSALAQYIAAEIGVEGLKHTVGILHAYYNATGARERKEDVIVSPYGLLKMMNYGKKAEDKDEQRKLMNTLLYLSRTWIQSSETIYEQAERARPGKRRRGIEYTPLLVLEALKASEAGGIEIPETVEFHLGKEFYDLLFGDRQQFYTLPTAQVLGYHSKNEQQEICLIFYLTNFITLNAGRNYSVLFPHMLEGSTIRLGEDINRGHDRIRDALRVLYALEHLQRDTWFSRLPHEDIDMALAAEYYLKEKQCTSETLAPETYKRIINRYNYLQGKSLLDLRRLRRTSLQNLLDGKSKAIEFKPGTLLQQQTEKIEAGRRKAAERNERAMTARVIKAASKAVSQDLAEIDKREK